MKAVLNHSIKKPSLKLYINEKTIYYRKFKIVEHVVEYLKVFDDGIAIQYEVSFETNWEIWGFKASIIDINQYYEKLKFRGEYSDLEEISERDFDDITKQARHFYNFYISPLHPKNNNNVYPVYTCHKVNDRQFRYLYIIEESEALGIEISYDDNNNEVCSFSAFTTNSIDNFYGPKKIYSMYVEIDENEFFNTILRGKAFLAKYSLYSNLYVI